MRQLHQILTFAIAISTITVLAFATVPLTTANALQEGDTVVYLVRADAIQPVPPSSPNDGLTFTGKPASTFDATGCAFGTFPLQQAVLVDVDGRSGAVDVIVISETDPIPAGTELTGLTAQSTCVMLSDGLSYNRYNGIATRTH